MNNNIKLLEKQIGYTFKNKNLIECALTHSSAQKAFNYERLEFLGDSLLSVIVAEHMFLNTDNSVGVMSVDRSNLVSTKALSQIVLDNNWHTLINVGGSFGKIVSTNVLADIFESLVAAIYLDSNILETKNFVQKFVLNHGECLVNKDYKTMLQEQLAQLDKTHLIKYEVISKSGPAHNVNFVVGLYINNLLVSKCSGTRIKNAEQLCAETYLNQLKNNGLNSSKK